MKISKKLNDIFTVILVLCAIIVTALVVKKEMFSNDSTVKIQTVNNWQSLITGGQLIGKKNAPVVIIEFTDFECPYCKTLSKNLYIILKRYNGEVALVVYNFPLNIHVHAYKLAVAGVCAAIQNRYEAYYNSIYDYQDRYKEMNLSDIARVAGIKDTMSFINCTQNKAIASIVNNEIEKGKQIKVEGTPTLIIDGKMIVGVQTISELDELIKNLLDKNHKK